VAEDKRQLRVRKLAFRVNAILARTADSRGIGCPGLAWPAVVL
jgi:hypothetical protein